MFCPRCGSNQNEDLRFCKTCGANLHAVRQVVDQRQTDEKFDWSRTWVAEMFQSSEDAVKRQKALELARGITPETKRYNEIKAGVITGSVGLALMIFLHIFMKALIGDGTLPAERILSTVWIAGVIPLFVGLALIFNGLVVSKKMLESMKQSNRSTPDTPELPATQANSPALRAGDTNEFVPASLSVTEGTTRHLTQNEKTN